jgi:hypothetical protein
VLNKQKTLQAAFEYEHEHRFTEHEHGAAKADANQFQPLKFPNNRKCNYRF